MRRKGQTWDELDLQPCGTPAAYKRHRRKGEDCPECRAAASRKRVQDKRKQADATRKSSGLYAPRNGLPIRPYVYRGTGADAFTGEVVT